MERQRKEFEVSESDAGKRLDVVVASQTSISRRAARAFCDEGSVRVEGRRERGGRILRVGERVSAEVQTEPLTALAERAQEKGGFEQWSVVIFEDENLLVVTKPRGIPSVRLRLEDELTLADLLALHEPKCLSASRDLREAGLVQRLDLFTSGLVLAAKSQHDWDYLHQDLLAGETTKSYLALVEGEVEKNFVVQYPLRQHSRGDRMETMSLESEAKDIFPAETKVEKVRTFVGRQKKTFSLVRVHGSRMRRHQVRIHLQSAGHSLAGDSLYGAQTTLLDVAQALQVNIPTEGFLLHAERLSFRHPHKGRLTFSVPSQEFNSLLEIPE